MSQCPFIFGKSNKQEENDQNLIEQVRQEVPIHYPSDFYQPYMEIVEHHLPQQEVKKLIDILKCNDLHITQASFRKQLQFQISETDFQSITVLLRYGNLEFIINVLITQLNDQYFKIPIFEKGNFGNVYEVEYQKMDYAIKNIILNKNNFDSELSECYQEYMMCYIASSLKVGPKVFKLFGYDMVVTQNSAFFAMQMCINYTCCSYDRIVQEITQNLRILHSINFIHFDIKPQNLAYSRHYNKCVFIDFGLSRLIPNKPGTKNNCRFSGTLSFCYEQMRNAYHLNKLKLVDLYYNDAFAINKSFKKIKAQLSQIQQKKSQEEYYSQENQEDSIIKDSINIFRLKFYIFTDNSSEVINILKKLQNIPKSCFLILNCKKALLFMKNNQQAKDQIMKYRGKIICQKQLIFKISDNIISEALEKVESNEGMSLLSLEQIIKLQKQKFSFLMQHQGYVNKIILFLYSEIQNQQQQEKSTKKQKVQKLIKKIQQIDKLPRQLQFYQKIDYFLKYLNSKLKKNRNKKNIQILRLLFISIQDLKQVQLLQDELINLLIDPVQKCLTVVQMFLFWIIVTDKNQYQKKNLWLEMLRNLPQKTSGNYLYINNIKDFSITFLGRNIDYYCEHAQYILKMNELLSYIEIQSSKNSINNKYCQKIAIIKALWLETIRIQSNFQINTEIKSLKVYSVIFFSVKIQKKRGLNSLFISFRKIVNNLNSYQLKNIQAKIREILVKKYYYNQSQKQIIMSPNQLKQEQKMKKIINFVFQIYFGCLNKLIQLFFMDILWIVQKYKRLILELTNKLLNGFTFQLDKINQNTNKKIVHALIYTIQRAILFLFTYIRYNKISHPLKSDRILNIQQKKFIFEKIRQLHGYIQNKLEIIKNRHQVQINTPRTSYEQINTKIIQKIILAQLQFFQSRCNQYLKQLLQQIYQDLKPIPCKMQPKIYIIFLQLAILVSNPIISQAVHEVSFSFLSNIIMKICQKQYISGDFYIFQRRGDILQTFINILIKKNGPFQCRAFIEKFISNFDNNKFYFLNRKFFQQNVLAGLRQFGLSCPQQALITIYDQIRFHPKQIQTRIYSFYIIYIFQNCYTHLQLGKCVRQLKRSCLSIKNMVPIFAWLTKQLILRISRNLKIIPKRKIISCLRMQNRYSREQNKMLQKYKNMIQSKIKTKWHEKSIFYFQVKSRNILRIKDL